MVSVEPLTEVTARRLGKLTVPTGAILKALSAILTLGRAVELQRSFRSTVFAPSLVSTRQLSTTRTETVRRALRLSASAAREDRSIAPTTTRNPASSQALLDFRESRTECGDSPITKQVTAEFVPSRSRPQPREFSRSCVSPEIRSSASRRGRGFSPSDRRRCLSAPARHQKLKVTVTLSV